MRRPAREPSIRRVGAILAALLLGLGGSGCSETTSDAELQQRRLDEARKLASLPYVAQAEVRAENRGRRGVVRHDAGRAWPGRNLYGSLTGGRAQLRDMDGAVVHQWEATGVFPDRAAFPLGPGILDLSNGPFSPGLTVAELHGDHLLAIESHVGLIKLDHDSRVVFALPNNAHHDLDVAPDGTIHVLTAVPRTIDTGAGEVVIVDDVIQRLAPDGTLVGEFSVFRILADDPRTRGPLGESLAFARYWFRNLDQWRATRIEQNPAAGKAFSAMFDLYDEVFVQEARTLRRSHQLFVLYLTPADVLHTNSLQVLPGRTDGLWQAGDVLVSVRELDLVAVLDLDAGKVVWSWGPGVTSRQHQPSLLANGHILLFDNGTAREKSRIIEVDPATKEIVWTWGDEPDQAFFCGAMGGVQGLPNGNVLITDSGAGRAFEVARDGTIVWDFFNPAQGHNPFAAVTDHETIEAIYRLTRVAAPAP